MSFTSDYLRKKRRHYHQNLKQTQSYKPKTHRNNVQCSFNENDGNQTKLYRNAYDNHYYKPKFPTKTNQEPTDTNDDDDNLGVPSNTDSTDIPQCLSSDHDQDIYQDTNHHQNYADHSNRNQYSSYSSSISPEQTINNESNFDFVDNRYPPRTRKYRKYRNTQNPSSSPILPTISGRHRRCGLYRDRGGYKKKQILPNNNNIHENNQFRSLRNYPYNENREQFTRNGDDELGNYSNNNHDIKHRDDQIIDVFNNDYLHDDDMVHNGHHHNDSSLELTNDPKYEMAPIPKYEIFRQKDLQYLGTKQFWVRQKSDGMRMLLYIIQHSIYLIDEEFNIRMLTDNFYGSHGFVQGMNDKILFDGELIISERDENHDGRYIFYEISDCISFNDKCCVRNNSSMRFKYINQFIYMYNEKLLNYAKQKNKLQKLNQNTSPKNSNKYDIPFWLAHPSDSYDTISNRLSQISTQIDNRQSFAKSIKDDIISLCNNSDHIDDIDDNTKHDQSISANNKITDCDDSKSNQFKTENVLNQIEMDVVSIIFTSKRHYKAIKNELSRLAECIEYENNNHLEGYYFTDTKTGIKTKNDGLIFVAENNGYQMNGDKTYIEITKLWRPKDLQTIKVKVTKSRFTENDNDSNGMGYLLDKDKEMDLFIDDDKLNLYISDEFEKKDLWFNSIEMGENEIDEKNAPFWDEWHLKQRSKFSDFMNTIYKKRNENNYLFIGNYSIIIECNYDFKKQSWSLYNLKINEIQPHSMQNVQDIIAIIEECTEIKDLIHSCN